MVDGQEVIKRKKKKKSKKLSQLTEGDLTESLLKKEQMESEEDGADHALSISDLKIASGQFVGVVGRVGSGKSTLLYSILGEIDKVNGTISRRGTIAYVPQVSWLRSATIR